MTGGNWKRPSCFRTGVSLIPGRVFSSLLFPFRTSSVNITSTFSSRVPAVLLADVYGLRVYQNICSLSLIIMSNIVP